MSEPFAVRCPSCETKLKIQNPAAIGKKVRCPKCQNAFTVQAPQGPPVARKTAPPEDEFDDFNDFDDFEDDRGRDDYEDFEAPAAPRRRSADTKRGTGKKKGKSRAAATPAWQNPVLIGGGLFGVLLIAGLVFFLLKGDAAVAKASDGNVVDMTWQLPMLETEALMHINVQPVLAHPQMRQFIDQPQIQGQLQQFERQAGFTIQDVISLTATYQKLPPGGSREPFDAERFIGVVRLSKDCNVAGIENDPQAESREHNGQTYYAVQQDGGEMCLFLPDARTLVVGPEESLKKALDTQGNSPPRPQFGFVDASQHVFFAFAPSDRSLFSSIGEVPAPMPGPMGTAVQDLAAAIRTDLQFVCLGGRVSGSEVLVKLQAHCLTPDGAGKISSAGGTLLEEGRKLYEGFAMMIQDPKAKNVADTIVNSASVSQNGQTAEITLTIPEIDPSQFGGGMPFPGGMPFGPGGGPGGGFGPGF